MRSYALIHRNVYAPKGVELTALDRAYAAWLWSGRRATLAGHSAAALLGSKWIPADAPVELARTRRPASAGIRVLSGELRRDETCVVAGISCTTPARTAYDLGRMLSLEPGLIRIDALLKATGIAAETIEAIAMRYPGARGIRQLRQTITFVDGASESPQETRLRLLLTQSGIPRPVSQIVVPNPYGRPRRIDMGWPEFLVGAEYDGEHHWKNPDDYAEDIERHEFLVAKGWLIVRVSARQLRYRRPEVVQRVRAALISRGCPL